MGKEPQVWWIKLPRSSSLATRKLLAVLCEDEKDMMFQQAANTCMYVLGVSTVAEVELDYSYDDRHSTMMRAVISAVNDATGKLGELAPSMSYTVASTKAAGGACAIGMGWNKRQICRAAYMAISLTVSIARKTSLVEKGGSLYGFRKAAKPARYVSARSGSDSDSPRALPDKEKSDDEVSTKLKKLKDVHPPWRQLKDRSESKGSASRHKKDGSEGGSRCRSPASSPSRGRGSPGRAAGGDATGANDEGTFALANLAMKWLQRRALTQAAQQVAAACRASRAASRAASPSASRTASRAASRQQSRHRGKARRSEKERRHRHRQRSGSSSLDRLVGSRSAMVHRSRRRSLTSSHHGSPSRSRSRSRRKSKKHKRPKASSASRSAKRSRSKSSCTPVPVRRSKGRPCSARGSVTAPWHKPHTSTRSPSPAKQSSSQPKWIALQRSRPKRSPSQPKRSPSRAKRSPSRAKPQEGTCDADEDGPSVTAVRVSGEWPEEKAVLDSILSVIRAKMTQFRTKEEEEEVVEVEPEEPEEPKVPEEPNEPAPEPSGSNSVDNQDESDTQVALVASSSSAGGCVPAKSVAKSKAMSRAGRLVNLATRQAPQRPMNSKMCGHQANLLKKFASGAWRFDPAQHPAAVQLFQHLIRDLEVDTLRHTHDQVTPVFRHGKHRGQPISCLTRQLLSGETEASVIPPLVVVQTEGWRSVRGFFWVVFGNRRLKALKDYKRALQLRDPQQQGDRVYVRCIVHDVGLGRNMPNSLFAKFLQSSTTENFGASATMRSRGFGPAMPVPLVT